MNDMRRVSNRMAAVLSNLAAQVRALQSRGFAPPVLEADPEDGSGTTFWLFADGQINYLLPDGSIRRGWLVSGPPPIPTFSSAPAFSAGYRLWFDGSTGNLQGYLQNGTLVTYTATAATTSSAGGNAPTVSTTSTVALPADPSLTRQTRTYATTWERCYCAAHGSEAALHYGSEGSHGARRVMFGFDAATIAADLAGAEVLKVELRGRNASAFADTVQIHFGTHTQTSQPATYSATRKDAYVGDWPGSGYGQDWRTASPSIGEWLRDGLIKGLTIDNPTTITSSGEFDRMTLLLRITYVS